MKGVSGQLIAVAPSSSQIDAQANYRGHVRIIKNRRYLEYADGTPLLLVGDTVWAINTARCALGEKPGGPILSVLD